MNGQKGSTSASSLVQSLSRDVGEDGEGAREPEMAGRVGPSGGLSSGETRKSAGSLEHC